MTWRREWAAEKIDIARALAGGAAGGGYGEAAIILSSVLSALAAEVWPGERGRDRHRFTELLIRHAPHATSPGTISVPLLADSLNDTGNAAAADLIVQTFRLPASARVITGADVDASEEAILAVCPDLERGALRKHSYAALLYGEVRSSYAHQYRPGRRADSWPMGSRAMEADVSYTNQVSETPHAVDRQIFFNVKWLSELGRAAAATIDAMGDDVADKSFTDWWLKGG